MKCISRMILSACGTGALAGCAPNPMVQDPVVVPAMKVRHSHESSHGYYTMGRYYHGARRYDDALASYRKALDIEPGHIDSRNAMAAILADRGDYDRAVLLLREITEKTPGASYVFSNLGYVYALKGDYESAASALEKAVALDAGNARAWNNLGNVLEKLGRPERAQSMYARGLEATQRKSARAASAGYPPDKAGGGEAAAKAQMADRAAARAHDGAGDHMTGGHARTELREIIPGIYEARMSAPAGARPAEKTVAGEAPAPLHIARLEISNGNGVTGLAKSVARLVDGRVVQVARITNQKQFRVASTRIEYKKGYDEAARALALGLGKPVSVIQNAAGFSTDVRLVLGKDMPDTKMVRTDYLNPNVVAAKERMD